MEHPEIFSDNEPIDRTLFNRACNTFDDAEFAYIRRRTGASRERIATEKQAFIDMLQALPGDESDGPYSIARLDDEYTAIIPPPSVELGSEFRRQKIKDFGEINGYTLEVASTSSITLFKVETNEDETIRTTVWLSAYIRPNSEVVKVKKQSQEFNILPVKADDMKALRYFVHQMAYFSYGYVQAPKE
jgi:hypothetical protein